MGFWVEGLQDLQELLDPVIAMETAPLIAVCPIDPEPTAGTVSAVTQTFVEILADNCADEHVAPLWLGEDAPVQKSKDPCYEPVSGRRICHHGQKQVTVYVEGGKPFITIYQIMNVQETIISLGKFNSGNNKRATILGGHCGKMIRMASK